MLERLDSLVAELLDRFGKDRRATPSKLLAEVFRSEGLKPSQQKKVKERFHGILAHQKLIDAALQRCTPGGTVARTLIAPTRILLGRVLIGDLAPGEARRVLEWVDWERVANLREELRDIEDPVARTELRGSLPGWMAWRLVQEFGDETDDLVSALVGRPPVVLRANRIRGDRDALAARLLAEEKVETRPTPHALDGLEVLTPARLFRSAAYAEGWFEMQDEASQLIAEITATPPGGKVFDACAGAGGKTLALASLLGGKGEVFAADTYVPRLKDLQIRCRRAAAHNVRSRHVTETEWTEEVTDFARDADRILVDVPCTGLGSLRRNPDIRWKVDEKTAKRLRGIQELLLERAVTHLKPGARAIYATCTVLRDENEAVVDAILERHPELETVSIIEILGGQRGRPLADQSGRYLQALPNRHGTDGFFCAVLRRPRDAAT